jgi:hypothetical protein
MCDGLFAGDGIVLPRALEHLFSEHYTLWARLGASAVPRGGYANRKWGQVNGVGVTFD